jgi:hypothetical protein
MANDAEVIDLMREIAKLKESVAIAYELRDNVGTMLAELGSRTPYEVAVACKYPLAGTIKAVANSVAKFDKVYHPQPTTYFGG